MTALPFAALEFCLHEPETLHLVEANTRACEWLGRSREDLLDASFEDTLPMLAGIGLVQRIRLTARSGQPMPFDEVPHLDPGVEQVFQVWAMSLRPGHVVVAWRERPGMALAPRRSDGDDHQRRVRLLFDLVPEPVAVIDRSSTHFVDVNQAWCERFGYTRDEALGRTSLELDLWVDPDQRRRVGELTVQDLRVQSMPVSFRRRGGEIIQAELSLTVVRAREGSLVVWLAHDRTAQHRAEEALRLSQAKLAAAFWATPDAISLARLDDGRMVDVNEAWVSLTGYSRDHVLATTAPELRLWPGERTVELLKALRHSVQVRDFEVRLRTRAGEHRDCLFNATVLHIQGEPHVLGVLRDVTERKRADHDLAELTRHLQELNHTLEERVQERTQALALASHELMQSEKLAALGRLVAGIAHELNTPIGNGLLAASTLGDQTRTLSQSLVQGLKRSVLEAYVRDATANSALLMRNLQRAADLIASFKQVAVDRTSMHRRRFAVHELVTENLMMLRPAFKGHCVEVVESVPPGLQLDSYPGPLGQVLTNLVDNALKHGFGPDRQGVIRIDAGQGEPGQVWLQVADNGAGIAPEHLKAVFEPFFTTALGRGGTGLGLHMVHSLVTSVLGGRIDVESAPGEGACFTLRLPVVAPAQDTASAQEAGR